MKILWHEAKNHLTHDHQWELQSRTLSAWNEIKVNCYGSRNQWVPISMETRFLFMIAKNSRIFCNNYVEYFIIIIIILCEAIQIQKLLKIVLVSLLPVDHFQTIGRLPSIRHMYYNSWYFGHWMKQKVEDENLDNFAFGMFLSKVILEQDCLVQFKVKENTTITTQYTILHIHTHYLSALFPHRERERV